ncbi:MAG TPA: hypothetical protein VHZ55_32420 [Bryobacteraceae bacterium]|nr:hypothetical protein [Bryobacteraceae bacterium]
MHRGPVLLLFAAAAAFGAADLQTPDLRKLPARQFQQLLGRSLAQVQPWLTISPSTVRAGTNVCSIPLLEPRVRPRIPQNPGVLRGPAPTFDHMSRPAGSVVCKNWLPK